MNFIDNILIKEMGFKTTTHDCCIYWTVRDGDVIYLLRMVDNCCVPAKNEKTAKDIFNIIGTKMSFTTKRKKGIVPFEFLGVVKDYIGVDIKQRSHYLEMSYENYIHCLSRTHGWKLAVDTKDSAAASVKVLTPENDSQLLTKKDPFLIPLSSDPLFCYSPN